MRSTFALVLALLAAAPVAALGQDFESPSAAWEAAWNAGDAAAVAAVYAEDAVVLPPGSEPVEGRAAIQAFWQAAMDADPGVTTDIETVEADVMGDVAIERGTYVDTGPDGGHRDHGKFLAIWTRVDGEWKILRDIFNSSMM